MDLSKELKVMLDSSYESKDSLIKALVDRQKEEQRLAEEKIHILTVVKLMESLKKYDFKSLIDYGVSYIRLSIPTPGTNVYRPDLIRIRFINAEKKQLTAIEEDIIKPILDNLENDSGTKLHHRYTNKFANMHINLQDNVEKIEEQILTALLAPHLKEIFISNKMNMELQNELNVNEVVKSNRAKI